MAARVVARVTKGVGVICMPQWQVEKREKRRRRTAQWGQVCQAATPRLYVSVCEAVFLFEECCLNLTMLLGLKPGYLCDPIPCL
jgi:hypothetical protein